MRTKMITIAGTDYPAIVSNRVILELQEAGYKSTADVLKELATGAMQPMWNLLRLLLEAGYKWEKLQGNEPKKPPAIDDIIDSTTPADIDLMSTQMLEAMGYSTKQAIEVEPGRKNGEAAQ